MLLGMDTSSLAASCALWEDGRLVGEFFCNAGLTHSQTAMVMVRSLLDCARRSLEEVDALAVSVGPGSFTGLRIGLSAVKGMALALDKPCAPVSTLEGLAENVALFPGIIAAAMDARCGQVYGALFRGGLPEGPERISEDGAMKVGELGERLAPLEGPVLLVGDGALLCREALGWERLQVAPEGLRHQRASSVCSLAARRGIYLPAGDLVPSYHRLSQAERERAQKNKEQEKGGGL